jgi:hypothetical protein
LARRLTIGAIVLSALVTLFQSFPAQAATSDPPFDFSPGAVTCAGGGMVASVPPTLYRENGRGQPEELVDIVPRLYWWDGRRWVFWYAQPEPAQTVTFDGTIFGTVVFYQIPSGFYYSIGYLMEWQPYAGGGYRNAWVSTTPCKVP